MRAGLCLLVFLSLAAVVPLARCSEEGEDVSEFQALLRRRRGRGRCPRVPTRIEAALDVLGNCVHLPGGELRTLCQDQALRQVRNKHSNLAYKQCVEKVVKRMKGKKRARRGRRGRRVRGDLLVADEDDAPACGVPLGMQSRSIRDSQITCSSQHPAAQYRCSQGRLHNRAAHYWHSNPARAFTWMQIDLLRPTLVGSIATQGGEVAGIVTEYQLEYSLDGRAWRKIRSSDGTYLFHPKMPDWNNPVRRYFARSYKARFVRIVITRWRGSCQGLRVELFSGCVNGPRICSDAVGMASGRLPSSAFSSLTDYNRPGIADYSAKQSRLFSYTGAGSYTARDNSPGQWIQVDLGRVRNVDGVATQPRSWHGNSQVNQFVRSYLLSTSLDGRNWSPVTRGAGAGSVFHGAPAGNTDPNVVTRVNFPGRQARFVRLTMLSVHQGFSLRWEVYDSHRCRAAVPQPPPRPAETPKRVKAILKALAKPKPAVATLRAAAAILARPTLVSARTLRKVDRAIKKTHTRRAAAAIEVKLRVLAPKRPCRKANDRLAKVLARAGKDAAAVRRCMNKVQPVKLRWPKFKHPARARAIAKELVADWVRRRRRTPEERVYPQIVHVMNKASKARSKPGLGAIRKVIKTSVRSILQAYFSARTPDQDPSKVRLPRAPWARRRKSKAGDPYNPDSFAGVNNRRRRRKY